MAVVVPGAISSVWPSFGARATWAAPIVVEAPGRFSTVTATPRLRDISSPMRRAVRSVGPPAA